MTTPLDPNTLFIRNIHYKVTAGELKEAFAKYGNIASSRILSERYRGRFFSRGIGFVKFESEESFKKALEDKTPIEIAGRQLKIQQARARAERKRDTIFIAGIPEGTTEQDILNAFAKFNPKQTHIIRFNTDKSKGFAFVQLSSPEDQEAAVKNGKTIQLKGGESIVRFARRDFDAPRRRRRYRRAPRRAPKNTSQEDAK
ncbi:RNA-binding protein [Histomonas meleagridis]|uniref:RNA-binding protein n=1 Tax=Histomonas meleagridis TaxID=135588 RepID=UPI0035593A12|nr:RNA-binding protein [Histomonas meleagridis]KAH0797721.1 RNA-binding protein [Histomonas meleagridis]